MGDPFESLAEGKPEALVATAARLVEVIEGSRHELEAALKWGQLTYAYAGDFHHWICAVGITRKASVLTFHFGGLLDDPGGSLTAGTSKLLRRLEYTGADQVDETTVRRLVDEAVSRYPWFKEHWREFSS